MKEDFKKTKRLIEKYSNIQILPSPFLERDTFPAALALFYSLRKLGKNVKLLYDNFPEKFNFLVENGNFQIPETDFLISINESTGKLSQIFYEKTNGGLNLYLKTEGGNLKEESITLKPLKAPDSENLLITFGVKNFKKVAGLLKGSKPTIINIGRNPENEKYGELNLIEPDFASFSEIVFDVLELIDEKLFDTNTSNSLLAGIIQGTLNFQDSKLSSKTFQKISFLMENGADFQKVISNLYKLKNRNSLRLFRKVLNKLKFSNKKNLGWVTLSENDFKDSRSFPSDLPFTLEKLTSQIFPFQNFFCLWENKSSPINIWGVFYSPNREVTEKILEKFQGEEKGNGILFQSQDSDIGKVKEEILAIINNE